MLLMRQTQVWFLTKGPGNSRGFFVARWRGSKAADKCGSLMLNRVFLADNTLYPRLGLLDSIEEPVYNRDFDRLHRSGFRKIAGSCRP